MNLNNLESLHDLWMRSYKKPLLKRFVKNRHPHIPSKEEKAYIRKNKIFLEEIFKNNEENFLFHVNGETKRRFFEGFAFAKFREFSKEDEEIYLLDKNSLRIAFPYLDKQEAYAWRMGYWVFKG